MMLKNKTIIIVGAAGRLGQVFAKSVAEAGANTVLIDNNLSALKSLEVLDPAKVLLVECDITDKTSIQNVFETAKERFGSVDGAVNTAYPRNKNYGRHFYDVEFDDFSENVSLHLGGYFLFMQQSLKFAQENKGKFSLVNLSSIYGVIAPKFDVYEGTTMTMPVEYAAIKSALQHLSSYVTAYAKGTKFRVNCVSPGGIVAGQDPVFLKRYQSHCREKGMLDAVDVVGTVLFLLSDSSEFICGQNIVIDDGFSN